MKLKESEIYNSALFAVFLAGRSGIEVVLLRIQVQADKKRYGLELRSGKAVNENSPWIRYLVISSTQVVAQDVVHGPCSDVARRSRVEEHAIAPSGTPSGKTVTCTVPMHVVWILIDQACASVKKITIVIKLSMDVNVTACWEIFSAPKSLRCKHMMVGMQSAVRGAQSLWQSSHRIS